MKHLKSVPRWILGLIYFVFGGYGFLFAFGILPMPETPPMPPAATAFMAGMFGTGYLFQLIKITEVSCGLLLLINKAVPGALVILAPITLNIFMFHTFLTPGLDQKVLPTVMLLTHFYLGYQYWKTFKPLFV
jgi:hypothetical protein